MAREPKADGQFKPMEDGFEKMVAGFGAVSERYAAQSNAPAVTALRGYMRLLKAVIRSLFEQLNRLVDGLDPAGAAQAFGEFVSGGIQQMLDEVNALIGELLAGGQAIGEASVSMLLGMIEAVKKAIYLVIDRIKLPFLTDPIRAILDVINNIIGNIAETLSKGLGAIARQFRHDMYAQLAAIDRARPSPVTVAAPDGAKGE